MSMDALFEGQSKRNWRTLPLDLVVVKSTKIWELFSASSETLPAGSSLASEHRRDWMLISVRIHAGEPTILLELSLPVS